MQRYHGELTTRDGERLLNQIAGFGDPPPVIVFSGGDPLMRPDLGHLIEYATRIGLPAAVIPAPTADLDRMAVAELRDAGARRMALSLDGGTPESHDRFRGELGSFEAAVRAARHAADLDLPIQINTTVSSETARELPGVADLVEELGAVTWEVFFLVPVGRGTALTPLSADDTEETLEWIYRRQRTAPFRVVTVEAPQYRRIASRIELEETGRSVRVGSTSDGNGFVFVSHVGEVCPSGFLPLAAGVVPEEDIVEIYRTAPLFRTLRDRTRLTGKCGRCEYRFLCGGSRARAWAATGDYLASDPYCPYEPGSRGNPARSNGESAGGCSCSGCDCSPR